MYMFYGYSDRLFPSRLQYFLWYLTLLPLIVPHLQMSVWRGGVLAGMWAAAQVRRRGVGESGQVTLANMTAGGEGAAR